MPHNSSDQSPGGVAKKEYNVVALIAVGCNDARHEEDNRASEGTGEKRTNNVVEEH